MPKHIFFDMDGTICESTCAISPEMREGIEKLVGAGIDVTVVSGARRSKMIEQLGGLTDIVALLPQNGNHAETEAGGVLWRNALTWIQKYHIFDICCRFLENIEIDNIQDRGCQVSFSLTGHSAPLDIKKQADPTQAKRKEIIQKWDEKLHWLTDVAGVQYAIGGTTCIDFYIKTKGENVAKFIGHYGWKSEDCLYIGDALTAGGNDATVIGIIPTHQVINPEDTLSFIKEIL